jgi:hypothetical protein
VRDEHVRTGGHVRSSAILGIVNVCVRNVIIASLLALLPARAKDNLSAEPLICEEPTYFVGLPRHYTPERLTHRFILKNNSLRDVRISTVKPSCDCPWARQVDITFEPIVRAQGRGWVDVRFVTRAAADGGLARPQSMDFGVYTTNPLKPDLYLAVVVRPVPGFAVLPDPEVIAFVKNGRLSIPHLYVVIDRTDTPVILSGQSGQLVRFGITEVVEKPSDVHLPRLVTDQGRLFRIVPTVVTARQPRVSREWFELTSSYPGAERVRVSVLLLPAAQNGRLQEPGAPRTK